MRIVYKPRARNAIAKVASYIESLNTAGSSDRWVEKLAEKIISLAKSKAHFAICKNASLGKFGYRCFVYFDKVIAFKITEDKFEVCRFIHGSRL